jgi:hypothetical protein
MILSKSYDSKHMNDNLHNTKVFSSPTPSLSSKHSFTNGFSHVLQHLQNKYPNYNIIKSYYEVNSYYILNESFSRLLTPKSLSI